MSDKQLLLRRRFTSADLGPEPTAPLDYLQLRNRDALRAWRQRYAIAVRAANADRARAKRMPRPYG